MGFELFGKRGHRLSTGACRVARVMMRDLFGEILSKSPCGQRLRIIGTSLRAERGRALSTQGSFPERAVPSRNALPEKQLLRSATS